MQSYGTTLQQFVRQQEAILPGVYDSRRHNEMIDYLTLLAESYNEQLRIFKMTESHREKEFLASLIRAVGG